MNNSTAAGAGAIVAPRESFNRKHEHPKVVYDTYN